MAAELNENLFSQHIRGVRATVLDLDPFMVHQVFQLVFARGICARTQLATEEKPYRSMIKSWDLASDTPGLKAQFFLFISRWVIFGVLSP